MTESERGIPPSGLETAVCRYGGDETDAERSCHPGGRKVGKRDVVGVFCLHRVGVSTFPCGLPILPIASGPVRQWFCFMSLPAPDRLIDALRELGEDASSSAVPYIEQAIDAVTPAVRPGLAGPTDPPELAPDAVARLLDHTQLRPAATDAQIDQVCEEATTYGFAAACVHPVFVSRVARALEDEEVTPCTVVGFPHGANRPATKAQEAERAVMDGAEELDMVLSLGALTSGRYTDAEADIRAVITAARGAANELETPVAVKVILETALLSPVQVAVACVVAQRAGADFVKTSTGFASHGARARDVALMRQIVGEDLGVKASGGVGSVNDLRQMVAHGATRIGASGSVAIVEEARASVSGT